MIYLIYRSRNGKGYPEPFADISTDGTAMISIAKGRNIGTTQFICGFQPETTAFHPLSPIELACRKSARPDAHDPSPALDEDAPF